MILDVLRYQNCIDDYNSSWSLIDSTLYRLCQENPKHTRREQVCAKLFIIGRTYSTGIERKVATDGTQGSSMTQVADLMFSHGKSIDDWIDELQVVVEPLTPKHLSKIVSVHGRMVKLISTLTRRSQSSRSFVSKYMHFHNPAVPIYDSIAAANAQHLVRWSKSLAVFETPLDQDECYAEYVMRFFRLYQEVAATKLPLKVKYVDAYLLDLVDRGELVSVAEGE